MGNLALVDTGLRLAFNAMKDLAQDVTFVSENAGTFDFTTGKAVSQTVNKVVRAVITTTSTATDTVGVSKISLLVKSRDLASLTRCTHIIIQGVTCKIVSASKDTGYVAMFEVIKNG
jgi:hypothetical protein